jgi:hypothetical protein
MKDLLFQIIGGLIVVLIAAWLGIGGTTKVVVHGGQVRKTGKWIILISVAMILGGLSWHDKLAPTKSIFNFNDWGSLLFGYGILFLIVGKVVAWFQRP